MVVPNISFANIRRYTTPRLFELGVETAKSGAVVALSQRGNRFQAIVEGREVEPHIVRIQFDAEKLGLGRCSCAAYGEDWCEHIVAALLTGMDEPDRIEARPLLQEILTPLSQAQLQQVIEAMVTVNPDLVDAIDDCVGLINVPKVVSQSPKKQSVKKRRQTQIDPAPFQAEARSILRGAVDAWESGYDDDPVTDEMAGLIAQAQAFSAHGDGDSAIVILGAITQGCVENWDCVADYGCDDNEVMDDLDAAWAEAILTAELAPEQQKMIQSDLEGWQDRMAGDFAMSLEALRQGWDEPALIQVLQNNITEQGVWTGEVPAFADKLALIRLQILDQQERYEEYLYLAEAEGQTQQYLTMLGRLGRVASAVTTAKTDMTTMVEAYALAQTLRDRGAVQEALEIAQLGLTLPVNLSGEAEYGYQTYDMAIWTSDLAEELSDQAGALAARVIAFKAKPSFADYQKIADLAGTDWSSYRQDLLKILDVPSTWMREAQVDIFLHEGLVDRAIASITDASSYYGPLLHRVMAAAIAEYPDWVIENARGRAERIIDRGKAEIYDHAVNWLDKMHDAYRASGRLAEWRAYRAQITQLHGRKYKLMTMMSHRPWQ
jgi:uncharacterized Zn finger protein